MVFATQSTPYVATVQASVVVAPGIISDFAMPLLADSANYTSGGVTFTFPSGTFSSTPTVRVTIIASSSTGNVAYVAYIVSVDQNSVTIKVTKIGVLGLSLFVQEAATDEVVVSIFANGL